MATAPSASTQPDGVSRLREVLSHLQQSEEPKVSVPQEQLSAVQGPVNEPLVNSTLADLLTLRGLQHRENECLVFPETNVRWTYGMLQDKSHELARGLLALGVEKGDRIGVMSGNCEQYVALFFAAAKVGAILVVINNTYSTPELLFALDHTGMPLAHGCPFEERLIRGNNRVQVSLHYTQGCPS